MLEWIRENKRWAQIILVLLVFPFACTGIEGYRRLQAGSDAVAKVGGTPITQQEFDEASRQQLERMQQMFGPSVDAKLLDTPEAKQAVLDQLVTQHAIDAEARTSKLVVTDDQLRKFIKSAPAFQDGGNFSKSRYDQYLATQRLSEIEFERRLRSSLALQQLAGFASESSVVPQTVTAALASAFDQQRIVSLATFAPAAYAAQVVMSDDALRKYYADNEKTFETLERADIEYVVLDNETLGRNVKVTDDEIAKYYEQNAAKFRTEERRRARHILINALSNATDAVRQAAQAKADGIRAQAVKNPAAFEQLARQFSDDPGSKDRGGDLDFLTRGTTVKPFEDAAFALKEGEISPVVRTEFGFHIIQVTRLEPAQVKPLNEVRASIEADLRKQQASKKFAESAEVFTNTVYEQSDSLKPVADKLGLQVQTLKGFGKDTATTAGPILANPKVAPAVFTDDTIKNHRNTQAIDVGPNSLVSVRVTAYQPRMVKPFDAVRDQVIAAVRTRDSLALARKAGEAELEQLRQGKGNVKFAEAVKVGRRSNNALPPDAARAVLRASVAKLPAFVGVDLGAQGYAIARIDGVEQTPQQDPAQQQALVQQLTKTVGDAETAAHLQAVRQRAKVEIIKPVVAAKDAKS